MRRNKMAGLDFSTDNKVCIRTLFNKEIIKHIKEYFHYYVIYFGLPSPEAKDIECWIDYIDFVIAFQCREYPNASTPDQPRDDVIQLMNKLNIYEEQRKIDSHIVYDGYIEEVVFNGFDNSQQTLKFKFDRSVTVFNLDFCNRITSPRKYLTKDGESISMYKFDLIDKILELQNNVSEDDQKFILFLTINATYAGGELDIFIRNNEEFLRPLENLTKKDKNKQLIRYFVERALYDRCIERNFAPYFLPTISYNGINNTPMYQFALFCTKKQFEDTGAVVKSLDAIIKQKTITPNDTYNGFENVTINGLLQSNSNIDFMNEFAISAYYEQYWKGQ